MADGREGSGPILDAERIGRRASATEWIVRDASLKVRPGDRIGLIGASGSGKSVFLRALALLDPLDEGIVRWGGEAPSGRQIPRYRAGVVYVHQRAALFEGTVAQNLASPFRFRVRQDRRYDEARAVTLLEALGRGRDFLDKETHDLSGGEAQIVAIVRVLQLDPAVLLLDEPTASLDRAAAALLDRVVAGWVDERPNARAVVWVGHDLDQVARVANVTVTMERGQLSPASRSETP